jgi:hypothetical protein
VNTAVFVLSTGRCGTQWLARLLDTSFGESALVAHEPLHAAYEPRLMLGAKEPSGIPPERLEVIAAHVAWIGEVLQSSHYIETGHPCWSSLPFLIERLRPNVKVIHLVRHPVPTAWSWITHQAFCPPLLPHLSEKVLLAPFDDGVRFPEYRDLWHAMTPYEKALYYWAEVNAFGLDLEQRASVPWLRIRFEDLLRGDGVERLFEFAGLETVRRKEPGFVDEYRSITTIRTDPNMIERHPAVLHVARELGYEPCDFDGMKLRKRYGRAD